MRNSSPSSLSGPQEPKLPLAFWLEGEWSSWNVRREHLEWWRAQNHLSVVLRNGHTQIYLHMPSVQSQKAIYHESWAPAHVPGRICFSINLNASGPRFWVSLLVRAGGQTLPRCDSLNLVFCIGLCITLAFIWKWCELLAPISSELVSTLSGSQIVIISTRHLSHQLNNPHRISVSFPSSSRRNPRWILGNSLEW